MKKNNYVQIRLTDELKEQFQKAADKEGLSLSDWLRVAGKDRLEGNVITTKPKQDKIVITKQPEQRTNVSPKGEGVMTDSGFNRFKRYRASESRPVNIKDSLFGRH